VDKTLFALSAGFGAVLLVAGLLMMRSHAHTWRQQKSDPKLGPADIKFYGHRYRRRMQASGMLAVIGVLLPVGEAIKLLPLPWRWVALSWAVFWMVVLLLVLWLVVLAMGDMISTRVYSTIALNRIRAEQLQLERKAAALRARLHPGKNGARSGDEPESEPG
jgi:hypothetical protein